MGMVEGTDRGRLEAGPDGLAAAAGASGLNRDPQVAGIGDDRGHGGGGQG
jgi:hypothetical protein